MKQGLLAVIVSLLFISACRKNHTVPDVPVVVADTTDSWKLILVYDKTTGTTSFPPVSTHRYTDVVLTFLPGNKIEGHTLINTIHTGTYVQNGNQITFGPYASTRAGEDAWGGSFLTVLEAQVPSTIIKEGKIIRIVSPTRYDITLQKL